MTLTEFLLARIADDERAAAAADGAGSARARDECESKRRIVELAYEATGLDMTVDLDRHVTARADSGIEFVGDRILRALALPYAHHRDYRAEWRL